MKPKIKDHFKFNIIGQNQIDARFIMTGYEWITLNMPLEFEGMAKSRSIMTMCGNCPYFFDAIEFSGPIPVVEADGLEFEVNIIGWKRDTSPGDGMKHMSMANVELRIFLPDGQVWSATKYCMQEYAVPFWKEFGKRNSLDAFVNYLNSEYHRDQGIAGFDEWALLCNISNFDKLLWGMLGRNKAVQALDDLHFRIMKSE